MRGFFWLVGAVGVAYLCYRFAAWRVMFQMFLIVVLISWVLIGLALVGKAVRMHRREYANKPHANLVAEMKQARDVFSVTHGEDNAQLAEQVNPQIWKEMALRLRPQV